MRSGHTTDVYPAQTHSWLSNCTILLLKHIDIDQESLYLYDIWLRIQRVDERATYRIIFKNSNTFRDEVNQCMLN